MSFYPQPFDFMLIAQLVERAPEVLVLDRFVVRGAPAAFFPLMDPVADPELHILRIGVEPDAARLAQRFQRADDRRQLHAVVGGMRFAAEQLPRPAFVLQQRAPSARAGIALAGAIGVDLHYVGHDSKT